MSEFDIPPGGIRLIRETRSESRDEFAAEIGVTRYTVGNWERGDATPRDQYREAIQDAIPADLSLEEVRDAKNRFEDTEDAVPHGEEKQLFGSKWLQSLRDAPLIAEELGSGAGVSALSNHQRMFVERLHVSGVENSSNRETGSVTKVYYLAGDERRALRRFIGENVSIIRSELQQEPNRFSREWGEWLYRLLQEEFRFWLYE